MLFRRSLYVLAIGLARSQGVDEAGLADIYRKYGDHLYVKGDFDGAMAQFVKTLGHLQPSYVIRKVGLFIDSTDGSSSTLKGYTTSRRIYKNCTQTV